MGQGFGSSLFYFDLGEGERNVFFFLFFSFNFELKNKMQNGIVLVGLMIATNRNVTELYINKN